METVNIRKLRPQDGRQYQFLSCTSDICIYGGQAGGGKTFGLELQPCAHVENPAFGAMIFRRTNPEITNQGGLWDEAANIYPHIGGEPRTGSMSYVFPSGARVSFRSIEYEKDLNNYDGSQVPLLCFDQLEHFSRRMFFYMMSRNRSACGVRPYIRATCNPQPNWLADFLAWWIDQDTGYARQDRAGVERYFVQVGDDIRWDDSREALKEQYPELIAKSVTFIPASLEDNPILMNADPGYKANLMALPYVDRERLMNGNWLIRDSEGAEWPSDYWMDIWASDWPVAFDLSAIAVDPSKGKRDGDPSAIVFVGLSGGLLYVDADIELRPSEKIILDGIAMANKSWPDAFGVEANGFQELLGEQYQRMCEKNEIIPLPMHLINNQVNKVVRIRRLGPYLKAGKIRIRRNVGGRKLLEHLSGFPLKNVHDDGPDALEMAIRLLAEIGRVTHHQRETLVVT